MKSGPEHIVIVGAGLAGAHAAEELRKSGYGRKLTLIGTERHAPYERPPLSKGVLLGNATAESTYLHSPEWYDDHEVELLTGRRVEALDLRDREVHAGGQSIGYDRLLLATGAHPRRLGLAEEAGAQVSYLRTLDDAVTLRSRLGQRLLVVGGGWIGLEVAAAAREAGGKVTVVETAPLPLVGVLGPQIAGVFADLHRAHGVDLRTGTTLVALRQVDDFTRVRLSDGNELDVDTIVVGIGAEPAIALAESSGLACSNGVVVDSRLRTSNPFVYAAGDIANHEHPLLGTLRVEHWDNAIQQGRHAALNMLGADLDYTRYPYFFTDQYDLGMEYVGHVGPQGYDSVHIIGDLSRRTFTGYWTRGGTVIAGMQANDWDAIDAIRARVGGPADFSDLP